MKAILSFVLLLFVVGANAQDTVSTSVLVIAPEASLGYRLDAPNLPPEALSEASTMALTPLAESDHGQAAWRGAKRGGAIGLGVGVMLMMTAVAIDADNGGCSLGDYFCATPVAALATIPLTLTGAAAGATIGWSASRIRGESNLPAP